MNQFPLSHAIHLGVDQVNRSGTDFRPNIARLITDMSRSQGTGGVIAVPSTAEYGSGQGYDLINLSPPDVPSLEITVDDLWQCAKAHYGLTAATAAAGIGGIPISKLRLGHHWAPGSSRYTNLISHIGVRFFPMTTLPRGSAAAKVAKSAFGTIRIFGVIGRALPFAAVGLAVFDAISIGMCVYERR